MSGMQQELFDALEILIRGIGLEVVKAPVQGSKCERLSEHIGDIVWITNLEELNYLLIHKFSKYSSPA